MKRAAVAAAVLMATAGHTAVGAGAAEPLKVLGARRGMLIGAAVSPGGLRRDSRYSQTLAREFSLVTTENALKWQWVQPQAGVFTWEGADAIVDFAVAHGLKVRGHTAIWHHALPDWIEKGQQSGDELRQIAREHVAAIGRRYGERLAYWDVVNEAVEGDGSLRNTIWLRKLGSEYIAQAFTWAHEAAPRVKLAYNDYGAEEINAKSDAIYALVRELRVRGAPIDAVGFQMHVLGEMPDPDSIRRNFQRFADLGVEVHVTEMDVAVSKLTGTLDERLAEQARRYRAVMRACLAVRGRKGGPGVQVFTTWGVSDAGTWLTQRMGAVESPLLFDREYQPKPAYWAVAEALAEGGGSSTTQPAARN